MLVERTISVPQRDRLSVGALEAQIKTHLPRPSSRDYVELNLRVSGCIRFVDVMKRKLKK